MGDCTHFDLVQSVKLEDEGRKKEEKEWGLVDGGVLVQTAEELEGR